MQYKSFSDIDKEIDRLRAEEKIEQALHLLKEGVKTLPSDERAENEFLAMLIEAILCTECGRYEACLDIVRQAVDRGFAFPLRFPRYQPLKKLAGYQAVSEQNSRLLQQAQAKAKAEYRIVLPEGYDPETKYPLFMALHGHGKCGIGEFSRYWKPDVFVERGFIFAYIQSSQVVCHDGYGWLDDLSAANADIRNCCDQIINQYAIDESAVFMGGFSGGAIALLNFIFSDIVPVKGFIALCPELKPDAFTPEHVRRAAKGGVKGVFLEGECVQPVSSEQEMMKTFDEEGLPYQYIINQGIGHDAPDDLDDKLALSLEFILG